MRASGDKEQPGESPRRRRLFLPGVGLACSAGMRLRTMLSFGLGAAFAMVFAASHDPQPGPPALPLAMSHGAQVYAVACACCHAANGSGMEPHCPALEGSRWLARSSNQMLAALILRGAWGHMGEGRIWDTPMAALGAWLSDEDIAAVAGYVRERFGGIPCEVPAALVSGIRLRTAGMTLPWSADELNAAGVRGFGTP